ncbi:MAG: CAP domain-containing protein [Ignavibacteriaceae bacterium]|nr:CAP domain-containing protein [Ignavibacteriaceae bacterium]
MKNKRIEFFFWLLLFLFLAFSCEDDSLTSKNNNGTPSNSVEAEVHRLINLHRAGIGLPALEWNDIIANECRQHSQDMANAHTINHDGFNERINKIGETISWNWAGENVAYNYSAQGAVTAWLNSPGHKSNIESNSNLTGVGVAFDEDSVMYFTQIFIKSN